MIGDFIQETSSAPGTAATINLAGAATGRIRFRDKHATAATVFYFMDDGTQAEWGHGTLTHASPDTLGRTVVGNTAGTTSRLNFTGTTRVYNAIPADHMIYLDSAGEVVGASAIGKALFHVADTVSALVAIGAPPIPTNSAAQGEWKHLVAAADADLVLPASGNWCWWALRINTTTGAVFATSTEGTAGTAGGATIEAGVSGSTWIALVWRVT